MSSVGVVSFCPRHLSTSPSVSKHILFPYFPPPLSLRPPVCQLQNLCKLSDINLPSGLAFLATDEQNKTFFKDFKRQFKKIRYLDDYMTMAGLKELNPNYLGMIDQVVCTRGTHFVGTWFSTFTGYITRMRGYLGYDDTSVRMGDKGHKNRYQKHELPQFPYYMREWNISWWNIEP